MENTPFLSLGEAAKATGKSKSTISKALKSGRLSGSKNEQGQYEIDPAELFRVYPGKPLNGVLLERKDTPNSTHETEVKNRELELELKHAHETIQNLKEERDRWHQEATANRRLLEHHTLKSPQKPSERFRGIRAWFSTKRS